MSGITLVALIITIIVMLILVGVSVSVVINSDLIGTAQKAADTTKTKYQEESELGSVIEVNDEKYLSMEEYIEGSAKIVDKDGNDLRNKKVESNTEAYDKYGNKIVIPADFKIRVDNTTNNADTVTEGIVIEDESGNQFVWIPVGKIYTDTEKTEANAKTITLGRRVFADGINDADGDGTILPAGKISISTTNPSEELKTITTDKYYYTEALKSATTVNAHARDIEAFIASTDPITGNGGYYIGRYEARKNTEGELTTISTDDVWTTLLQTTSSSLAQEMYPDGYKTDGTGTFSSDLINSFAWDTAIIFLQTFDNRKDRTIPYSYKNSVNIGSLETKGTGIDLICNIYDMASNCLEWSTETCGKTRWHY